MTDAPTLPETGPDADLRARNLAQLDRLDELAEIGMKAARLIGARADAAGPDEDLNALAMAYSRAARAVRMCVLLHAKVVKDIGDGDHDRTRADAAWTQAREDRKSDTLNLVYRRAGRAHGEDLDAIERLMTEATERLDYEDMYGDLMTRPIEEMADEISGFLGLGEPAASAAPTTSAPAGLSEADWCRTLIKATEAAEKALAAAAPDSS